MAPDLNGKNVLKLKTCKIQIGRRVQNGNLTNQPTGLRI